MQYRRASAGSSRFGHLLTRSDLVRLEWRARHRRAGRGIPSIHRARSDEVLIDLRDAVIPLGVPLPTESDFEPMGETLGGVVHEPKGRASVGIARGEHSRHRRSQRLAIALRERDFRPELAGGLLLAHAIGAQK